MKDELVNTALCVFIAVVFTFAGCMAGKDLSDSKFKRQAIEMGHAQYNPTTGEWEWKEQTDDR